MLRGVRSVASPSHRGDAREHREMSTKARGAARRIRADVRRWRTAELIISGGFDEGFVDRPISFDGLLRLMREYPDVVRGDGSRRRAAELRRGLGAYRAWLAGFGEEVRPFAVYLFDDEGYPEFDLGELYDIDLLAYRPPRLTTNYEHALTAVRVGDDFGWADNGGRSRPQLRGAAVDGFGKHRRWQELIGERAPNSRLKEPQVVEIRERYAAGGVSYKQLAKEYGVSSATISGIVWGSFWIYAPGPVKCRQLMRARCTSPEASYNVYGERTRVEDHPRPDMLNTDEAVTLERIDQNREDERYVPAWEVSAWSGDVEIEYEWGRYVPVRAKLRVESVGEARETEPSR